MKENNQNNNLSNYKLHHFRLYELVLIIMIGFNLFLLTSLITHSSSDYIWLQSGNNSTIIINWGGRVGVYLSEFLFLWFGHSSYLIPIVLILLLVKYYRKINTGNGLNYLQLFYNFIGFIILLVLVSGFAANNFNPESGGWIGLMLQKYLSVLFGQSINIVYVSLIMASLSLTGYLSWLLLFDKTGRVITYLFALIIGKISHIRHISKQKEQIKTIKKDRLQVIKDTTKLKKSEPEIKDKNTDITPSANAQHGIQSSLFNNKQDTLPALSLLDPIKKQENGYSKSTLDIMSRQVEAKLKDFGFNVNIETITPGPVVTQFEISLEPGVKVSKIINLNKDLARALLVESVRILDVIPGKPVIGLEIPNAKRELITLKEILSSNDFENSKSTLTATLGKDINGKPVIADLAKMPHLLVAGATGMGKSVGLNAIILSILYKSSPKNIRMIMIDPKIVEMATYADIPHLLTPVITDMNEAYSSLRWAINEMEHRYNLLAKFGVRNISAINNKIALGIKNNEPLIDPFSKDSNQVKELEHIPLIVIIIDEYADMLAALAQEDRTKSKRVEALIIRLAQKARAAGIHLVIATQRPSVDVITGLIKSNIPTRIAFRVSSKIDSRTILDQGGAEQLLGMGDMLYMTTGQKQLLRVHGAFVSDDEVSRVCASLKENSKTNYIEDITRQASDDTDRSSSLDNSNTGEKDSMYDEAVEIVLQTNRASISSLQRRLRIGYNRAARIIEDMEIAGIVSSMNSNGNREILAPRTNDE